MKNPEEDNTPDAADCSYCNGSGSIRYSECCGSRVVTRFCSLSISTNYHCANCGQLCNSMSDRCEECKGEGFIKHDEEKAKEEHNDLRENEVTGN